MSSYKKPIIASIKTVFEFISNIPFLGKNLNSLSCIYSEVYSGFSYDFRKNGELAIIKALPSIVGASKPVIFDVGANVGDWTNLLKQFLPNADVHCFEISPKTFANLKKNTAQLSDIHLNNFGLSDKEGEMVFTDFGENNGGNTLVGNPSFCHRDNAQKSSAILTTGDAYVSKNNVQRIDFLKMDVEGWEYFVLKGFGEFLDPKNISVMQFEYGYAHADVHTLMRDFYNLLAPKGYAIGRLCKNGVDFSPFHFSLNDFKSGPNFVACSPELFEKLSCFSHR